jgi:PAN domain
MTLQTMSFIFGALLLAVAILGGGFEIKELKVSNVTISVRIISGVVGLIFIGLGFWQPTALPGTVRGDVRMSQREDGKDRFGGDYFDFDVKIDRIEDCENACKADTKCAAWTYVKPGYRGPQARCYLKTVVPAWSDNSCCVSGRKLR